MSTRRFSPVVMACAAAIALVSVQVHAQTSGISLTNNASLATSMSAAGARSFEAKTSTTSSNASGSTSSTPTAGGVGTSGTGTNTASGTTGSNGTAVGTNGTGTAGGTGSSGSSTFSGTTDMANASTNQYSYNSNGQLVNTGTSSGEFMGPPSPYGTGAVAGTVVGATTGTAATGGMDWLKMVQIAAPVVAGLSGNSQIAQVAGLAGSGAQIYNAVSTGQELTAQNYANMANIALQGAALATNNTNIDKAAALGTLGTGAWNAYSALTPSTTNAAATAATGTLAGYSASGQPIYTSNVPTTAAGPAAGSAFNWNAVASIAQTTAPSLGNITGNATIGQLGQAVGLTGQVYNQTGGFSNTPNTQQLAGIVSNGASQVGYMTGNQQLQQVSQVANTTGQLAGVYNAQGQQVYAQPQQQVYNAQGQAVYAQPQQVYNAQGQQVYAQPQQQVYSSTPVQSMVTTGGFVASQPSNPTSSYQAIMASGQTDHFGRPINTGPSATEKLMTGVVSAGGSSISSAITGWLK